MKFWIKLSLFNLIIVCFAGVIMRYKIAFSLPFVDQKFLLHAHSHFAFSGWITQLLMVFLISNLVLRGVNNAYEQFKHTLLLNALCSYGMLLSFPFQGYGAVSISFSTLSIFTFFVFGYRYFKCLNKLTDYPESRWFKAGIWFYFISTIGTFFLAYMMMNQVNNQKLYLSAVYFYLHFQYNGWFFFAAFGLLIKYFSEANIPNKYLNRIFLVFILCVIPGYFLSVLWLPLPNILYWFIVVIAVLPLITWISFIKKLFLQRNMIKTLLIKRAKWLFILSAIALTIKLVLQAGSVVPELSKISYTYRPIIIGYLHLILLGVFTIFLLAYLIQNKLLHVNRSAFNGIKIFVTGIILNEIFLLLQGTSYMNYLSVPYINEILLVIAFLMLIGLIMMFTSIIYSNKLKSTSVIPPR